MRMKHGYYLIWILCAYSGTMEKLRSKDKKKRKMDEKTEKKKGCRKSPSQWTTGRNRTSGA